MRQPKKTTCRWLDNCMDCCRHPSTYERFRRGDAVIFPEYKCICRKGCGYERYDESHPMWFCASAAMPTTVQPKPTQTNRANQ